MSKFCSACGTQLTDEAKFCFKCGNPCGEPTVKTCPECHCNMPVAQEECLNCGYNFNAPAAPVQPDASFPDPTVTQEKAEDSFDEPVKITVEEKSAEKSTGYADAMPSLEVPTVTAAAVGVAVQEKPQSEYMDSIGGAPAAQTAPAAAEAPTAPTAPIIENAPITESAPKGLIKEEMDGQSVSTRRIYCKQCGTQIQEGAKFCLGCAAPVADMFPQAQATKAVRPMTEQVAAGNASAPTFFEKEAPKKKSPIPAIILTLLIIAVIAVDVLIFTGVLAKKGDNGTDEYSGTPSSRGSQDYSQSDDDDSFLSNIFDLY